MQQFKKQLTILKQDEKPQIPRHEGFAIDDPNRAKHKMPKKPVFKSNLIDFKQESEVKKRLNELSAPKKRKKHVDEKKTLFNWLLELWKGNK